MAEGTDVERCVGEDCCSCSNNVTIETQNGTDIISNPSSNFLIMAPLHNTSNTNSSTESRESAVSSSHALNAHASLPVRSDSFCSNEPPRDSSGLENRAFSKDISLHMHDKHESYVSNNISENSPSTSGLKGILKHRQRHKSDGHMSNGICSYQGSPERPTLVLIAQRNDADSLAGISGGGDPTWTESLTCTLDNNNFSGPFHVDEYWSSTSANAELAGSVNSFNVDVASANRNVEFELSDEDEQMSRPSLMVDSQPNGHCHRVRLSPPVVVTDCESTTADDGVVKAPIRTKKGILKKRSKSTESLPKRNSIRFSDYEDEIIFHNQEEQSTVHNDPSLSGSSCSTLNRQRKGSLQENYSSRSFDTQAIADQLKSILKTSITKGRESLPSSSEELCGILKRTTPNDSEGSPFSLSSESNLKMKGILKTQISSEDSSRYSSLEDFECSILDRTQSVPAENSNRLNPSSNHLSVNTQLKGILRGVDSARKTSAEVPLVSSIVSSERSVVKAEALDPAHLACENNNHQNSFGSSNSCSNCYSRSDSCGSCIQGASRPQSFTKEIKVRSILKNSSSRSCGRRERQQLKTYPISHSTLLSKSLMFESNDVNGVKSRISFPDNGDNFSDSFEGQDEHNGVLTNNEATLDSCLYQSSSGCAPSASLQQPVKSILRTTSSNNHNSITTCGNGMFSMMPQTPQHISSMHLPSKTSATSFISEPTFDVSNTSSCDNIHGATTSTTRINSIETQNSYIQLRMPDESPSMNDTAGSDCLNEDAATVPALNADAAESYAINLGQSNHRTEFFGNYREDEIEDNVSTSLLQSTDPDESYDEDDES